MAESEHRWDKRFRIAKAAGKAGREYMGSPRRRKRAQHLKLQRRKAKIIVSLRTNHYPTNVYLHKIQKRDNEKCRCGADRQTVEHVLLDCGIVAEEREIARKRVEHFKVEWKKDREIWYSKEGAQIVAEFWNACEKKLWEKEEEKCESDRQIGWGDLREEEENLN